MKALALLVALSGLISAWVMICALGRAAKMADHQIGRNQEEHEVKTC